MLEFLLHPKKPVALGDINYCGVQLYSYCELTENKFKITEDIFDSKDIYIEYKIKAPRL